MKGGCFGKSALLSYAGESHTVRSTLDRSGEKGFPDSMTLKEIREAALPACREFGVRRLDAFGSIARGTATASSDVDLLVEFKDPGRTPARRFFGLLHSLEDVLACDVDLLTVNGLRNPYFRRRVLEERVPVYEG
jgi:predicted nucleotidyltransferase